ncbi:uncharacterized protein LOC123297365 isoform X2 [Chrysoperla carnea]|nr:uncharacterized protein LOC123297365 isoform X2 [Chrysoperla carnea]
MMYWIVFALFTCAETFTDVFLCWFPFYYELKIIIVIWLLSPATKGSSILYRKFVHPLLSRREQEIDEYINKAKEQGYHTVLHLGSKGVNYATTVIMQTAIKGGGGIVNQLKKSYSLSDLTENEVNRNTETNQGETEETDGVIITDPRLLRSARTRAYSPKRSSSGPNRVDMYFPEVDVDVRQTPPRDPHISHIRSSDDISSGYSSAEYVGQTTKTEAIIREGALIRTASVGGSTRSRTKTVKSSLVVAKKAAPTEEYSQDDIIPIDSTTLIYLLRQANLLPLINTAKVDINEENVFFNCENESDSSDVSNKDESTSQEYDDAVDFNEPNENDISKVKSEPETSSSIPTKQDNIEVSDQNIKTNNERSGRYKKHTAPPPPMSKISQENLEKNDALNAIKATLTLKQGLLKTIDSKINTQRKHVFVSLPKISKSDEKPTSNRKENFLLKLHKKLPFWSLKNKNVTNVQSSSLVNIDQLQLNIDKISKRSSWHEMAGSLNEFPNNSNNNSPTLRQSRSHQDIRLNNETGSDLFIRNMSESPSQRRKNIPKHDSK